MRQRQGTYKEAEPAARPDGSSLLAQYAAKQGWQLAGANIFVEGTTDVDHFRLADGLYRKSHGLCLLSSDMSMFPVGKGKEGGCWRLSNLFVTLRSLIRADDLDGSGIKMICLLDDDPEGRGVFNTMTGARMGFGAYTQVLRLQRKLPRHTRSPREIERWILRENEPWKDIFCEVEDLLSRDVLEEFCRETPDALERPAIVRGDAYHYPVRWHLKPALCRYAEKVCTYEHVQGLIECLKALRFILGCDPDGMDAESP